MAAGFQKGIERLEDIFQDEILPSFASTDSFKRFARSSNGLCLDESDIQQISEDASTVEDEKMRMLQKWREKIGPGASASKIRFVLRKFLHPDPEEGYVHLSEEYGLYKEDKLSKHSQVYMGEHRSPLTDPRKVVVKLVVFDEKNKNEVKILQKLGPHTNVVTMFHHGVYQSDITKFIYIVMESCRPENLGDYLQKMKELGISLKESQKLAIIKQFLEGLKFIHFNEFIHRDIKPQNLLISKNGKFIKICDYGLTKSLSHGCSNTFQSSVRVGTDGFRAPETYLKDTISKKSDIFASGLVVYTIVSDGEHAYGNDSDKWNSNIKDNVNRSLDRVLVTDVEQMTELLEWMLQHNPGDRPTVEEVLKNDILERAKADLHLPCIQASTPPALDETVGENRVKLVNEPETTKLEPVYPASSQPLDQAVEEIQTEDEVEPETTNSELFHSASSQLSAQTHEEIQTNDENEPETNFATRSVQYVSGLKLDELAINPPNTQMRFIDEQPEDGRMKGYYSTEALPECGEGTYIISYSFPSGKLKGISYSAQEFTAYLPRYGAPVYQLREAFNAGMTFKLEIEGENQGTIVWNDIPHKMSKTGGPERNGYPDYDYPKRLYQVLKSKGFSDSELDFVYSSF